MLPPDSTSLQLSLPTDRALPSFVPVPPVAPSGPVTPEQILFGPPIDPQLRIKGYSEDEFENFIREWAYYYGQLHLKKYVQVGRFGGAGDMGRDVVGYIDPPSSGGRLDIFQCKHYAHPLHPGDVWVELGKLCYYTFRNAFAVPTSYRFVAPEDVGPELGRLFENPSTLREKLIANWANDVEGKIIKKERIKLEGDLLSHVQAFDFSRVGYKPIHEIIAEHRNTTRYAPRFGGGLVIPRHPDPTPPATIESHEQRYIAQLVEAYRDHDTKLPNQTAQDEFDRHFVRSRERYFCAEGLRHDVRDNLPQGVTFEQVQDQVYETVIDSADSRGHASGYVRVKAVTDKASLYQLQDHPLRTYLNSKILMGICHQLANIDRLRWVPK